MRLDKYLKVSRVIVRRAIANKLADHQLVYVNGKLAKASYEVKVDDVIEIILGEDKKKIKVVKILEFASKVQATEMYTII
jgi:ribosomal 50S subunit-recycling heat shock protein